MLLLAAWLLRLALIFRGGQNYFPDENRYARCVELLALPWFDSGAQGGMFSRMLNWHDHAGFMLPGCLAALCQKALMFATGWSAQKTIWAPAAVLSLASTLCIALTYGIARRCNADEMESFLAAFLMACSNVMFFYSRHLLPYDASLAFALASLFVGFKKQPGPARSIFAGFLDCLCFLVYYGYWNIALIVGIIHLTREFQSKNIRGFLAKSALFGIGAIGPLLMLNALTIVAGCVPFFYGAHVFSHTIAMGDFDEAWRLPWEYLWHAETGLLLVWIAGGAALAFAARKAPAGIFRRAVLWFTAAAAIYLMFVVFSCGLKRLVVYGRLVRQMVPFLCLGAACSLSWVLSFAGARRYLRPLSFTALAAVAAFNQYAPLAQRFPQEVKETVFAHYDSVHENVSVIATSSGWSPPRMQEDDSRYALINAQILFAVIGTKPAPAGEIVFSTPHPLQYKPYQYEGCTPAEREIVNGTDMSMRLIDTAPRK